MMMLLLLLLLLLMMMMTTTTTMIIVMTMMIITMVTATTTVMTTTTTTMMMSHNTPGPHRQQITTGLPPHTVSTRATHSLFQRHMHARTRARTYTSWPSSRWSVLDSHGSTSTTSESASFAVAQ